MRGDSNSGAAFFLIFLIPRGSISIPTNKDIRHPVGGSAHLITDCFYIDILACFDDQLIMHVSDNETIAEVLHCKAEKVSGDSLNDVLNKFRAITFDAFPFLCGSDAFVGNGFATETIFTDTWFHVGEASAGRKLDEKHSTLIKELDPANFCRYPF